MLACARAGTETLDAREAKIRENWVRTMEARIVRDELQKCHKAEGVNHYQVCNELAKKYLSLLEDAKVCFINACL